MSEQNKPTTHLARLLATRLCHDLAGPMGGISNGIEFLGDSIGNDAMAGQSLELLKLSSSEGSAKLQVARRLAT